MSNVNHPPDESVTARGCFGVFVGLVLGFGLVGAGVVMTARSLDHIFGDEPAFTPETMGSVVAGVALAFVGARLWALAARAKVRLTWRQALASLPGFATAGWFIVGWAAPDVIGRESAGMLVGVIALEFIIIHASIMLVVGARQVARQTQVARWWRTPRMITAGLLAAYSLFAAGISAAFGSVWLFIGFWGLMANKYFADWLAPAREAELHKQEHLARWGLSAMLYVLLAFGSVFIPVPRLSAISASGGGGLWEREPQQALAMGAVYFLLIAFAELYGIFSGSKARKKKSMR